jgi:TusE/DsrC/DsvC family sulfur relay protein
VSKVKFENKAYEIDEHGYLDPPEQWDTEFAEGLAETLGIRSGLSEEHWKVIRYLRQKFVEDETVPLVADVCLDNDISLSELRSLFPTGYHRGAVKIAGINYRYLPVRAPIVRPHYELDEMGFLADFETWNLDFAEYMMADLGREGPTGRHWDIIRYLRDYYEKRRSIPSIYETCAANNLSLKEFTELFPDGYRRGACRIAGLPFFV